MSSTLLAERLHVGECFGGLAQIAVAYGKAEPAARLLGATEAVYESLGFVLEGRKRKSLDLGNGPEDMLVMAMVW